jgi:predicted TIM-barrel fold metal-dependent hydrolase
MLIVDSQIHIWENARMPGQHRQIPTYSKDDALAEMREGGVDAALIHPPSTLPQTVPTAIEAARLHPDKFAILGHLAVERPENRALIDTWKQQPGMLGLRFTFNQPHQQSWWTDGTVDWLWPAPNAPVCRSGCWPAAISMSSPRLRSGTPASSC